MVNVGQSVVAGTRMWTYVLIGSLHTSHLQVSFIAAQFSCGPAYSSYLSPAQSRYPAAVVRPLPAFLSPSACCDPARCQTPPCLVAPHLGQQTWATLTPTSLTPPPLPPTPSISTSPASVPTGNGPHSASSSIPFLIFSPWRMSPSPSVALSRVF